MGRSLYFTYEKVMDRQSLADSLLLDKLSNLKPGNRFKIYFREYMEYDGMIDDYVPILTRSPSTYGYNTLPIEEGLEYTVLNNNIEPGLEKVKGIRSINFALCNPLNDEYLFNTHRIITDGTIRECEGLGINYEIDDIEILE